jgi:hypothetical protein
MENADNRNVAAPTSKVIFNEKGVGAPVKPVTCKTVKLKAANVPG